MLGRSVPYAGVHRVLAESQYRIFLQRDLGRRPSLAFLAVATTSRPGSSKISTSSEPSPRARSVTSLGISSPSSVNLTLVVTAHAPSRIEPSEHCRKSYQPVA